MNQRTRIDNGLQPASVKPDLMCVCGDTLTHAEVPNKAWDTVLDAWNAVHSGCGQGSN